MGIETFESTEQCKNDYPSKVEIVDERLFESIEQDRDDCFSEVEIYYDAQDKLHGSIKLAVGSVYHLPEPKKAQILQKLQRIPVDVTICKVNLRILVGWCGVNMLP